MRRGDDKQICRVHTQAPQGGIASQRATRSYCTVCADMSRMMVEEVRALNLNGSDRRIGWVCEWIYYPKEPMLPLN